MIYVLIPLGIIIGLVVFGICTEERLPNDRTERWSEMTDEQIIKALKCCSSLDTTACEKCPYFEHRMGKECVSMSTNDTLALIERQREEKEEQFRRLGKEIYVHCSKIVDLQERLVFERTEAIQEVFEKIDTILRKYYEACSDSSELKLLEPIRQAERFIINEMWHEIISLKKEMTEEQK